MTNKLLILVMSAHFWCAAMTEQEVFEQAFGRVLINEGGESDRPDDPGGHTKYGITKASYPNLDIASLTKDQARDIYFRDFWGSLGLFRLYRKPEVASKVMDLSVNVGGRRAIMILQRALRACGVKNVDEDGILGSETADAAMRVDEQCLLVGLRSEGAGYYRSIVASNQDRGVFLKGWLNRAYQ